MSQEGMPLEQGQAESKHIHADAIPQSQSRIKMHPLLNSLQYA